MKRTSSHRFFFAVGIVEVMILLTLGQGIGNLWFRKATNTAHRPGIRLEALDRALMVQPSHSYYWFSLGREFLDLGAMEGLPVAKRRDLLERAEKCLTRAIFLEPTASLYHYHLGWVYSAISPYRPSAKSRVRDAFRRAISLNPVNTDFRWGIANYYLNQYALSLNQDEKGRAETEPDRARVDFQRHFRAFLEIGSPRQLSRVLNRCFAVTQNYEDFQELIPDQPSYHLRLAEILSRKGVWNLAREEFEIAISQDPRNPDAYHTYGSALYTHEHYEEALAAWKVAQEINRKDPRSYLYRSKAFWALNRKEEAIAELERLVDIQPDQTSYRLALAARLEGAGDLEKAFVVYRDALAKDPKNPKIYAQMANYWAKQKKFSEAEAALNQAISLSPSAIGYQNQLAGLFFQQKRYSRAVQEWQHVLEQNPGFLGALTGIARSYEALQMWTRALHYYRKALVIKPDDSSIHRQIETIERKLGIHPSRGAS